MTAVDVDALAKLREAIVPGPDFSWDAVETLLYALPDLIAAVRERDALREAVEALADLVEQGRAWTGDSLARRLRAVLAAVDGGGQR